MPSLFYIGYDVKREERYFPPFELVRRLAKPPDSGWRQMMRGKASIMYRLRQKIKKADNAFSVFLVRHFGKAP